MDIFARSRSWRESSENNLLSITDAANHTTSFDYDSFGRVTQTTFPSTLVGTYLYDGSNSVAELDASGNLVARHAQGAGVDEPLAEVRGGTVAYFEQDGLGSVTSLSNSTAALANTYTYDSFGRVTASTGAFTNPFQYTGRDTDTETGLRYYRNRYYDPSAGRFLSEDPLEFKGGDVNFYAYVLNSPTELVDPEGLQHKPGGPPHLLPGVKFRCRQGLNRTQGDSCEELQRKMMLIGTLLAGHALWDMEHGGNRHSEDIDSLFGALMKCLKEFNKYCVDCPKPKPPDQPEPQPTPPTNKPDDNDWWWWPFKWAPVIPRIPGPFPVIIDPCVLQPWQPYCDGGRKQIQA